MRLDIQAKHINQIFSADVINVRDMRLSSDERDQVLERLLKVISEQASQLSDRSLSISTSEMKLLADQLNAIVKDMGEHGKEGELAKKTPQLLETLRGSFGNITDIILNAVKLAQIGGLL